MTTEARPTEPLDGRWMVALAKPRQQEVAREEFERRGIVTYFPMTKKDVFNRVTGRFEKFPEYYFGRYFFVEYTPNWIKDVLHVKGVADVLHYDVLVPASEEVPLDCDRQEGVSQGDGSRRSLREGAFDRI